MGPLTFTDNGPPTTDNYLLPPFHPDRADLLGDRQELNSATANTAITTQVSTPDSPIHTHHATLQTNLSRLVDARDVAAPCGTFMVAESTSRSSSHTYCLQMNSVLTSATRFSTDSFMSLIRILHFELLGFLCALAAVVLFQIATRRINLDGLITHKDGSYQVSPERIQLLLATIAASATYFSQVVTSTSGNLPDISSQWLYLFAGSSGIYVAGKAWVTYKITKIGLGGSS